MATPTAHAPEPSITESRTSARRVRRPSRGTLLVIGIFVAVRIAYLATGGRYTLAFDVQWQVLDPKQLSASPFGNVARMHIQPPLFNLLIGIVERWSPFTAAISFQILYLLCGLALVVAVRALLLELGFSGAAATTGACLVALDPITLTFENSSTYEYPVALLLVLAALLCARAARKRDQRTFVVYVAVLTAVVMTRALFHPLWLLACVALLAWRSGPRFPWRTIAVALIIPAVCIGGWVVKNQAMFGDATLSSWFGMNLQRGVIALMPKSDVDELIKSGKLSPAAAIRPLSGYDAYAPLFGPCTSDNHEAVLASPTKSGGQTNYNAECFLPVYAQEGRDSWHAIQARPKLYLERRFPPSVVHFTRNTAPQAVTTKENATVTALRHVYNAGFVDVPVTIHDRSWAIPLFPTLPPLTFHPSLLLILATLLIIGRGILGVVRGRPRDAAWTFIGLTVGYTALVSIMTEYGENSRFRFTLDPIVLGVIGAVAASVVMRLWSRMQHGAAEPNPTEEPVAIAVD